jgi:hypothetical protein
MKGELIGMKWVIFIKDLHRCILPSFDSFGQAVSEKIFRNWPFRNKNCLNMAWPQAILVSDWPIFLNLFLWNCLAKCTETL